MVTLVELIQNLALLAALSVVSGFIGQRWERRTGAICQGLLFGMVALVGMMNPLVLGPGLIFDGRSVVVSLCAFFFGPLSATIAATMACVYRVLQGGDGALTGLLVIGSAFVVGLAFHYRQHREKHLVHISELIALGISVHIVMLLMLFTLPDGAGPSVFRQVGPHVMLTFPAATVIIGKILSDQRARIHLVDALQESNSRFQATLSGIGDGVISINRNGDVEWMNPMAEAMTGWTLAEACNMPLERVYDVQYEHDGTAVRHPLERAVSPATPKGPSDIYVLTGRNGTQLPIADNCAPIHDEGKGFWGVVIVFRDETSERNAARALRQSEERFVRALENIPDAVFICDTSRAIQYSNQAARELIPEGQEPEGRAQTDRFLPDFVNPVFSLLSQRSHETRTIHTQSLVREHAGGDRRYLTLSCVPLLNEDEHVQELMLLVHDLTDSKRAEEAARESEHRLQMALQAAQLGDFEVDLKHQTAQRSLRHDQIFGYPDGTSAWSFPLFLEHVHPEDRAVVRAGFIDSLKTQSDWHLECRIIWPDGSLHYIWGRGRIFPGEDGAPERMLGVVGDITARFEADSRLRERDALLTVASRIARLGGWTVKLPDVEIHWSDAVCAIHEVPPGTRPTMDEAIGFYQGDSRERIYDAFAQCIERGIPFDIELELVTSTGNTVWIRSIGEAVYSVNGDLVAVQGALQDISERKHFESSLTQSEARFRQLADVMPLIVWTADPAGNVDYANHAMNDYSGLPSEIPAMKRWLDSLHPDDMDQGLAVWIESVHSETPYSNEFRLRRHDGSYRWQLAKATPIRDEDDRITKWIGTVTDIHDGRLAQEQIHQLATRQTIILESITDAFFTLDHDWRFSYINEEALRHFQRDREALLGGVFWEVVPESKGTHSEREYRRAVQLQRTLEFETHHPPMDRWFEVRLYPSEEGLSVYFRDISERKDAEAARKSLEEQLRQSQKLEAVGRLAGGVAHDFNNMLSVILGHTEMLLTEHSFPPDVDEDLEAIRLAAERSANLTAQLLAFARKQTISPKPLSLNDTVPSLLSMLRRLIGESIELVWKPSEHPWLVNMDPSQIDQLLANFIVNARDAIDGNGEIVIETANTQLGESDTIGNAIVKAGDYVVLTVLDSGRGMELETLNQIFEPFFTTKPQGEGTGLGLSTVYGIAQQNRGFIDAHSEPGKGSRFSVYLPRHESDEAPAPTNKVAEATQLGNETILLVEDEQAVLTLGTMLLKKLGYNVLAAPTATEALEIVRAHPGTIHLLITDVIMPEMSGGDVAAAIGEFRPEIKTLFVSGYTADVIADHGVLDKGVHFLSKPFTIATLSAKIREALDSAPDERIASS